MGGAVPWHQGVVLKYPPTPYTLAVSGCAYIP